MTELEEIELLLNEYYENNPLDRQTNESIKNRIKELIISVHEDVTLSEADKQTAISAALKLLGENTGCAEDCEIAEAILDDLFHKRKMLNQKDIDYFWRTNADIGRWL